MMGRGDAWSFRRRITPRLPARRLSRRLLGGLAGYGTGLLLPFVLVPLIGAEATIPVIGLSALITNPSRVVAFRRHFDKSAIATVAAFAFPSVLVGAYCFTLLSGHWAQIAIGAMLILLGPFGHICRRLRFRLSDPGFRFAAALFGLLMGATSGSGVILLAILMARGLSGLTVIATDSAISSLLGVGKVGIFFAAGALPRTMWLVAVLIGLMAIPGAMVGKKIAEVLPGSVHLSLMDGAVTIGGIAMLVLAWK